MILLFAERELRRQQTRKCWRENRRVLRESETPAAYEEENVERVVADESEKRSHESKQVGCHRRRLHSQRGENLPLID